MRDWVHIAPMRWVIRHEMQPGQTEMETPRRPRRGLYYDAPDVKRRRTGNADKTHGCTNMLAWLRAMDPDAFGTLMTSHVSPHAVFRVVMRGIPHPQRFVEAVMDHNSYQIRIGVDIDQFELSRYYIRYVKPRMYMEPNCIHIECLTGSAHARICGLQLTVGGPAYVRSMQEYAWSLHRIDFSKSDVAAAATEHGVCIRPSWNKKRIWREIVRVGPNARQPRFKTYLTHRVVKGPCGSWCVVATKHVV